MSFRTVLLFAVGFSAISCTEASAKPKNLYLVVLAKDGCFFWVDAEPRPVWQHVKRVKVNGSTKFRHDNSLIQHYPEEIRLHLTFYPQSGLSFGPKPTRPCTAGFNPAKMRFSASWRHHSTTTIATGALLNTQWHAPAPWCELNCTDHWTYDIRLDSTNVPIEDELLMDIKAEDGTVVSHLSGQLEYFEEQTAPIAPAP